MGRWADIAAIAGLALAALSAALPPAIAADGCPTLEEAARRSGEQYQQLTVSRGVSAGPQALPGDLRGVLASYLGFPATPNAEGRNGLLFYHRAGDAVCGYLIRGREDLRDVWAETVGHVAFRLPVATPQELAGLVEEVRLGLSQGAVTSARAPRLRSDAEGVTRGASSLAATPTSQARIAELTGRLSDVLFSGIADLVEELENLSIVPALNIGTVPFAALDPNGDGVPLAASVSVNVEASLGDVLAGRIFSVRPEFRPQAIAGDPDATNDPQWIFPRLPGAETEARAVAVRFGTEPVLGNDATIAEVTARLSRSAYIHIAAHGLSDAQDPVDGSFLALSDGRLTARRIQEMRLPASPLVVLSACQTGLGGTLDAGIVGLARGFMLAGASSVVSSLWNVDDAATAWIMTRFLAHLDASPPAEALRLAQMEARERWPHPSVWSSFVLFGSRSVVLGASAASDSFAPAEFTLKVHRKRDGQMSDIADGEPLLARGGDEVHATVTNRMEAPASVDFVYVGSGEAGFHVASEWLDPGGIAEVPLVAINGDDFRGAGLVTLVREASPFTPLSDLSLESNGMPGLVLLNNFVERGSLPKLFPEGIHTLATFGAPASGANAAMPERFGRGGVFVTPLVAED